MVYLNLKINHFEIIEVQRLFNAKCDKHLNCEEIVQQAKKFYNYDEFPEENERLGLPYDFQRLYDSSWS